MKFCLIIKIKVIETWICPDAIGYRNPFYLSYSQRVNGISVSLDFLTESSFYSLSSILHSISWMSSPRILSLCSILKKRRHNLLYFLLIRIFLWLLLIFMSLHKMQETSLFTIHLLFISISLLFVLRIKLSDFIIMNRDFLFEDDFKMAAKKLKEFGRFHGMKWNYSYQRQITLERWEAPNATG